MGAWKFCFMHRRYTEDRGEVCLILGWFLQKKLQTLIVHCNELLGQERTHYLYRQLSTWHRPQKPLPATITDTPSLSKKPVRNLYIISLSGNIFSDMVLIQHTVVSVLYLKKIFYLINCLDFDYWCILTVLEFQLQRHL